MHKLRWVRKPYNICTPLEGVPAENGYQLVLQGLIIVEYFNDAGYCIGCETEWRDVPVVDEEDNADPRL